MRQDTQMNTLTMSLASSGQEISDVLHVHDVFQGQGYGTLLIKSMYKTFSVAPLYLHVDDCSSLSGTPASIYNKIGSPKLYDTLDVVLTHDIV